MDKKLWLATLVLLAMSCSSESDDAGKKTEQSNAHFKVDRQNVDNLTPATVVSLRGGQDVEKIPEYLGSLCKDYSWMNSKRFIHIFADSRYSEMFSSFGIENIKAGKPVDKYLAVFNPDEQSVIFFPLVNDKTKRVRMKEGWCSR